MKMVIEGKLVQVISGGRRCSVPQAETLLQVTPTTHKPVPGVMTVFVKILLNSVGIVEFCAPFMGHRDSFFMRKME
jgi:hypothetical protein